MEQIKLTNAEIFYLIEHLEWSRKYPNDFFKKKECLNPKCDGRDKLLTKLLKGYKNSLKVGANIKYSPLLY